MEEVLSTELENVSRRLVPIWTTSCLSFFFPNVTRAARDLRYGKCLQGQCWKTKQRKQKKSCVPAMWKVHQAASLPSDSTSHKMGREFRDWFSFRSGIPAIL